MGVFDIDKSFDTISRYIQILEESKSVVDLKLIKKNLAMMVVNGSDRLLFNYTELRKNFANLSDRDLQMEPKSLITSRCCYQIHRFSLQVPRTVDVDFVSEFVLDRLKHQHGNNFIILVNGFEYDTIEYDDEICKALIYDFYGIV